MNAKKPVPALATPNAKDPKSRGLAQLNTPSIRSKFLAVPLSIRSSKQSEIGSRAKSSMSGTFRGVSVNDHFRSNSRLRGQNSTNQLGIPGGFRSRILKSGLYTSGASQKDSQIGARSGINGAASNAENGASRSALGGSKLGPGLRVARNTSTSSFKLSSRELPVLKSQISRMQPMSTTNNAKNVPSISNKKAEKIKSPKSF